MNILQKIFSIKKEGYTKYITILGIKIKRTNRIKKIEDEVKKLKYQIYKYCPDKKRAEAMKDWFFDRTGEILDLENPKTFNQKIQWLKLYDSTPIKTKLADKYLVRDWIKEKIGEEYLIPLLGVWDKAEDIDFNKLPNKFVLKCNHGSGCNIIVNDKSKLNIKETIDQLNVWIMTDYSFLAPFELHYHNIPRKIIAEKYLETKNHDLQDYKFLCFGGEVKYIWVDKGRFTKHRRNIYDTNWIFQNKQINKYKHFKNHERPKNLGKMLEFAKILSQDFSFVRVDFYEHNDRLYFGEMTFTSESGLGKVTPKTFDNELGKYINLKK